jgi:hypothetical protein
MHIDVFKADGFSASNLTLAINDTVHKPMFFGASGLFAESGIATTTFAIDRKASGLSLIPVSERGGIPDNVKADKGKLIYLPSQHIEVASTIHADEIQNLRAFGSETEFKTMQYEVNIRLQRQRDDMEVTLEHHMMGAVKGQVLDADGSAVLTDMFTEFGLAQKTQGMLLTTSATKVRTKIKEAIRKSQASLGGKMVTGYMAVCGDSFHDTLTDHDDVRKSFTGWSAAADMREDNHYDYFNYGGVNWYNYRGSVGGVDFVGTDDAYLIPLGVRDMFVTHFAPADTMEFANTRGLPYYSMQQSLDFDKGIRLLSQTNPMVFNTNPDAVIKLTKI